MAPSLFGLESSNRDFSQKADWGKNCFNNAFPAAFACYLYSKDLAPIQIKLTSELKTEHGKIPVDELFGAKPLSPDLFFAFENLYLPYEGLVTSTLPRIDLVTCALDKDKTIEKALRGIEIKLTAIPDNSTADMSPDQYGSEIVVRPDTIVYIALSIATNYLGREQVLSNLVLPISKKIRDWNDADEIASKLDSIKQAIDAILLDSLDMQEPLVLQPIWKTKGKTLELEDQALDAFVWTDYAFTRLFIDQLSRPMPGDRINRQMRTTVWLLKMLHDFVTEGKINHTNTIRHITFGAQTDKAFAVSGRVTRAYLRCPELITPRISKFELRNIILNGGEKMLSPERRFDAAIQSNISLFE